MSRPRTLPAAPHNSDPPIKRVAVDVSSVDKSADTGEFFTGLNCTVAGLIYTVDLNGTTLPEYMQTGWNPCTACVTIKNSVSNTATVITAKVAVLVLPTAT